MSDEVKTCPFCGAVARHHEGNDYAISHSFDCLFSRQYAQDQWLVGKKSIAKWNTRTPDWQTRCETAERERDELIGCVLTRPDELSQLQQELERLKAVLQLILPMAKGYANLNNFGNNHQFIAQAEQLLRKEGDEKCTTQQSTTDRAPAVENSPASEVTKGADLAELERQFNLYSIRNWVVPMSSTERLLFLCKQLQSERDQALAAIGKMTEALKDNISLFEVIQDEFQQSRKGRSKAVALAVTQSRSALDAMNKPTA